MPDQEAILKDKRDDLKCISDILEGITVYIHIVSDPHNNFAHAVSISDVPFINPEWKQKDKVIYSIDEFVSEDPFAIAQDFAKTIAVVLALKGHEVYVCSSKNPGPKIGDYEHYSLSKLTKEG